MVKQYQFIRNQQHLASITHLCECTFSAFKIYIQRLVKAIHTKTMSAARYNSLVIQLIYFTLSRDIHLE